jgi:hypothetical protein
VTLQAIVDCVCKSYRCYQSDLTGWEGVREIGLSLLLLDDLEHYCIIFPDEGDLQDEWEKVVVGRRGTNQLHLLEQYLDVLVKHTTEILPPTALVEGTAPVCLSRRRIVKMIYFKL